MIKLNINHTKIISSNLGTLVEGNINSTFLQFVFSSEWDKLARIAVFTNGSISTSVSLTANTCAIPWEVLSEAGELYVAVKGIGDGGRIVICTKNEFLGCVYPSNANGETVDAGEATPSVIDTLLADVAELKVGGGSGSGIEGADGKSAYEIACKNGFVGNEAQWLDSLKGADGQAGTNGTDGHTPIKGVDYFTDADKAQIVQDVVAALPVYNGEVI